ncbi:hypothetical protein NDI76_03225 [Halogeometricum sp. S1BR25-6]|uniref:DoxX family membrane protein n=1 Tax=Halogeometricum salsisoli TaxID=2950536 RepID=A0ABU2GAB2_9EURY|nr:hypothetical protein [Halogeometricum sp. S1BR25-6]MDS0297751.1 hypothetical protein [Halogeometricum sp. S1BR25-6]
MSSHARYRRPLLYVMSAFYTLAGVMHFVAPEAYERVVPPQFPRRRALVYVSGVAEVVLGVGVLPRRTRRQSAWGLVALLFAVFPANVYMATNDTLGDVVPDRFRGIARVAAWVRLPLQGVLMLWAWRYTRPASDPADDSP